MKAYLESYAEKHLRPDDFRLGSVVVSVKKLDEDVGKESVYEVVWQDACGALHGDRFHNVVIASGFFAKPVTPQIDGIDTFPGSVLHSGEYQDNERFRDRNVVVVGSSFSSAEIAADIAQVRGGRTKAHA
jgi:cation diffusion facilitator CzcD-associated flavoprotein CzcO